MPRQEQQREKTPRRVQAQRSRVALRRHAADTPVGHKGRQPGQQVADVGFLEARTSDRLLAIKVRLLREPLRHARSIVLSIFSQGKTVTYRRHKLRQK